jgi:hypothetical protein
MRTGPPRVRVVTFRQSEQDQRRAGVAGGLESSGQDTLTGEFVKGGGAVRFTFKAGRTEDLRHHGLVFAAPKDAKVEMAK